MKSNVFNSKILFTLTVFILALIFSSSTSFCQQTELTVQTGHNAFVTSSSFSTTGELLVSADTKKNIIVWNVPSARQFVKFTDSIAITSCIVNPQNTQVISGHENGEIHVWDIASGILSYVHKFEGPVKKIIPLQDEILVLSNQLTRFHLKNHSSTPISNEYSYDVCRKGTTADFYFVTSQRELHVYNSETKTTKLIRSLSFIPKKKSTLAQIKYDPNSDLVFVQIMSQIAVYNATSGKKQCTVNNQYFDIPFEDFAVSQKHNLLVAGSQDAITMVFDLTTGKKLEFIEKHLASVNSVVFSPNENLFATGSSDYSIIIWDSKTRQPVHRFHARTFPLTCITNNNRIALGNNIGQVKTMDLSLPSLAIKGFRNHTDRVNNILMIPEKQQIISAGSDNFLAIRNWSSGTLLRNQFWKSSSKKPEEVTKLSGKKLSLGANKLVYSLALSEDGKELAVSGKNFWYQDSSKKVPVKIFTTEDFTKKEELTYNTIETLDLSYRPNTNNLLIGNRNTIALYDRATSQKVFGIKKETWEPFFYYSFYFRTTIRNNPKAQWVDENSFYYNDSVLLCLYNIQTQQNLQLNHNQYITSYTASSTNKSLFIASTDHRIYHYSNFSDTQPIVIQAHNDTISDLCLINNDQILISISYDGTMKLWDAETNKLKCTIVPVDQSQYVAYTPENYYMVTKGGLKGISFKHGNQFFPPEQFDLKYNRPDIVLASIGLVDEEIITAYHQAYQKRLQKLGFEEQDLGTDFHLPSMIVRNSMEIPVKTTRNKLHLELQATDSLYSLEKIFVWNNDVPVNGLEGITISGNLHTSTLEEDLELIPGENKIQVSCINEKGVESLKKTIHINYDAPKVRPDLYIVTIGASKYHNSDYNLEYAEKDASDVAGVFAENKSFGEVKTKTLLNDEVTKENILQLKEFLKEAKVHDVVIVFIAGHGVLDDQYNYYFATHDLDFNNPSENGIEYREIENLLDGITALRKLLIMDTCHSGEIEKEDVELSENDVVENTEVVFRAVGPSIQTKENKMGWNNSTALMKDVFADLRRGTGATVISSSGGAQLAMESAEWKNGLFTYCLLNGLKSNRADLNQDGTIMISELQQYVQNEVFTLSKGNQTPTSRIENISMDFEIWSGK